MRQLRVIINGLEHTIYVFKKEQIKAGRRFCFKYSDSWKVKTYEGVLERVTLQGIFVRDFGEHIVSY